MRYIRELPDASFIREEFSLTEEQKNNRNSYIALVKNIISGKDKRKLLIVGPCSSDREDAVTDYAVRLAALSEKVKDKFIIVPRIYTSKPRTTGEGYKGILHNPDGDSREDILSGVVAARKLHIKVISETGLYSADEMLYPEEMFYLSDLLCYMAVGARSVEDQGHRMVASDDIIPVGMKNPTGGSKIALVNSLKAAQTPHTLMYRGWEVSTNGNEYAHAILRGYTNMSGKSYPNYHYEDLCEMYDLCQEENVKNASVIVDCNHANSNKKYDQQIRIAKEVQGFYLSDKTLKRFVKGFMIESYIEDGSQLPGGGVYGRSITDPCLGWEKTERLIKELAEIEV